MGISGSRTFTLSGWASILGFLVLCFSSETCNAKDDITKSCTSSCGDIHNISYPFRLNHDPEHCGDPRYNLFCESNITVLGLPSGRYYVQAINYDSRAIRLLDPGLEKNDCSSVPRNFPFTGGRMLYGNSIDGQMLYGLCDWKRETDSSVYLNCTSPILYLKCGNPVNSSLYVDTAPCLNTSSAATSIQPKTYIWLGRMEPGDLKEGCSAEALVLSDYPVDFNASYQSIHSMLMYGFKLRVYWPDELVIANCWSINNICYRHSITGFFRLLWAVIYGIFAPYRTYFDHPLWLPVPESSIINMRLLVLLSIVIARLSFGVPIVTAFLIYKWRKRHLSMYSTIEDFLHRDNNFMPIRYSYSDIKKMTHRFTDKLGEGGYGSVFKGKLRSGRFAGVKVLGKPKANEQDFISEIATIGTIHHANVVELVGYCVEGSKRALVYDFMPNGSLDRYIYSKEGSIPLSCMKMYEISCGVARGIEYLHQGCEMQILHFDIKPHNILLDENFIPKISDFGLAKLYPVEDSIVSLTAARGTMGYIAPELFYKNIGGVSYKADVYSFGMLLMEIASRRKNWKALVEHSSQIYFPSWVYDQYNEGKDLEIGQDVTEEEKKTTKKMVITALWCIQMKPSDRPSMNKVIEMLEGKVECLQMPPKPFICPQEIPIGDLQNNLDPACSNRELTCTLSAR